MKSILFTPDNMAAAIDGRKRQTRRIIKNLPEDHPNGVRGGGRELVRYDGRFYLPTANGLKKAPHNPADILVGRSTWAVQSQYDHLKPSDLAPGEIGDWFWLAGQGNKPAWAGKSRPGRFLPKTLWHYMQKFEVTAVRVERVQDISEADAIAEGCKAWKGVPGDGERSAVQAFVQLWDSINEKRDYSWRANPWVWVIEFKKVTS